MAWRGRLKRIEGRAQARSGCCCILRELNAEILEFVTLNYSSVRHPGYGLPN